MKKSLLLLLVAYATCLNSVAFGELRVIALKDESQLALEKINIARRVFGNAIKKGQVISYSEASVKKPHEDPNLGMIFVVRFHQNTDEATVRKTLEQSAAFIFSELD